MAGGLLLPKLCQSGAILLLQASLRCTCRYPELLKMLLFGCHQHRCTGDPAGATRHRLGNSREGTAAPDNRAEQTSPEKTLSFPQTGVDPGKVYLARKKYVKRQEKGTAQPPTKLPNFLLRQNKVLTLGSRVDE